MVIDLFLKPGTADRAEEGSIGSQHHGGANFSGDRTDRLHDRGPYEWDVQIHQSHYLPGDPTIHGASAPDDCNDRKRR